MRHAFLARLARLLPKFNASYSTVLLARSPCPQILLLWITVVTFTILLIVAYRVVDKSFERSDRLLFLRQPEIVDKLSICAVLLECNKPH